MAYGPLRNRVADGLVDRHGSHMKAAASRWRGRLDGCLRLFTFGIRRLHLGPILYDLLRARQRAVAASRRVRRHSQMFELTLLLAATEGAAS